MTALLQTPRDTRLTLLSQPAPEVEGGEEEAGERRQASNVEGQRKGRERRREEEEEQQQQQLSLFALFITILRRSLLTCNTEPEEENGSMEIGWPTEVRHVAHVTFDRFHGFLGLPSEFQTDVPTRAPSASTTVFGVSTESMQCSYDPRGNSVPTILLMMQRRLYAQGGLQAEGIFRITADNAQEEHVRDQLNHGIVPENIDVHCLAGLIKAWFRELPNGVLDVLTPEQVMQCQNEEDYIHLLSLLPPAESALLNWAVNLMADVVQLENCNKMNAHNIATVFAPNMTQMGDPLHALMHAVQVMNFLKTLIMKTLRERQDAVVDGASVSRSDPPDQNDRSGSSELPIETPPEEEAEKNYTANERLVDNPSEISEDNSDADKASHISTDTFSSGGSMFTTGDSSHDASLEKDAFVYELKVVASDVNMKKVGHPSESNVNEPQKKANAPQPALRAPSPVEKAKGILTRISSSAERVEAWR